MPIRAQKKCARCGNPYSGRRCPECLERWQRTSDLRQSVKGPSPYESKQWRDFSRAFLRIHTTCECVDCLRLPIDRRPRSQVTDHKDGLGPLGPRGFDETNCQAMTIVHHGRKTARYDGGFGHARKEMI